ncbi:peptidase inhibitor family I36 protein [Kitasatospora sp. NPDC002227]|uniref:peptidase inhibitor family I36 protein n=1 Tax=Kitasatospora sp. NPDC002227 TaxID=3154773 RepID=UPI00332DBB1D
MRLRNLAAAGLLALAATGVGVSSASASTACANGYLCLYSDSYWSGAERVDFYSRSTWTNITYAGTNTALYRGDGVGTNVSSVDNGDFSKNVAFYYNSNYSGPCFTVAAGRWIGDFSAIGLSNGLSANDNMNSHHFGYTCGTVYYS